jgi:hypothetical protein
MSSRKVSVASIPFVLVRAGFVHADLVVRVSRIFERHFARRGIGLQVAKVERCDLECEEHLGGVAAIDVSGEQGVGRLQRRS